MTKSKVVSIENFVKYVEEMEEFIPYLIYFGLYDQAERILDLMEKYSEICHVKIKNIKQIDFEKEHPELTETYPDVNDFKELDKISVPKFDKFKFLQLGREKY
jgi:hypothetical protein